MCALPRSFARLHLDSAVNAPLEGIASGSLSLLGMALAYWLNPGLVGLSAFVGAGLCFAGLSDTCGMGIALAKMPWNR